MDSLDRLFLELILATGGTVVALDKNGAIVGVLMSTPDGV